MLSLLPQPCATVKGQSYSCDRRHGKQSRIPVDQYLENLRHICARFPEAQEDTLQDRPMFHVRRRRFAILNSETFPYRKRWATSGDSLHFATDEQLRTTLSSDTFFSSPHHGFRGWRAIKLSSNTNWREISSLLARAYRSVAAKELVTELDRRVLGVSDDA